LLLLSRTGIGEYGIVYVTAFPNAKEFKKHVDDIAWETEVWLYRAEKVAGSTGLCLWNNENLPEMLDKII